jgi:RHS repeat-associated protein
VIYWSGHGNGLPYRFWWSPYAAIEYHHDDRDLGPFVTAQVAAGDVVSFKREGNKWVPTEANDFSYEENVHPIRWMLEETNGFFYLMDPLGERIYIFCKVVAPVTDAPGLARVERVEDRNGNALVYTYAAADDLHPAHIDDGLGRSLDFTYQDVNGRAALVSVSDQRGRSITFDHKAQGADNQNRWTLRSVSDATGATSTFRYTTAGLFPQVWTDLITEVERPEGNVPYEQTYAVVTLDDTRTAAVTQQSDAYGNNMGLSYDADELRVTETRPDGATVVYEHFGPRGYPKSITDAAGNTTQATRNEATNRLTSITDRMGNTTTYTYHQPTGKLAFITDALGNTTTFTYTGQAQTFAHPDDAKDAAFTFYNVTDIGYGDGTTESYTYDATGNLLTVEDRRGETQTYTYNARGQMLTRTNPAGGALTFTYNADGTLASSTDSDHGVTTYSYDGYKRLVTTTLPDGSSVQRTYDLRNRLTAFTDELGRTATFNLDDNGNVLSTTNALSETITYAYDEMDRVETITDPAGGTIGIGYDDVGRPSQLTDANGNTTTVDYDLHGHIEGITDALGHTWTYDYDEEGRLLKVTTPLGHETTATRDALGRTTSLIDPLGNATALTYDALHRLNSVVDRMGRTTSYTYDKDGHIVRVDRAGTNPVSHARSALGQMIQLTDPRGGDWGRSHTPMGRVSSATDPLDQTHTHAYNTRGWWAGTTYADGSTGTYTYDASGSLTQETYGGGPTVNYRYDAAGRPIEIGDLSFRYDARGMIVATDYEDASLESTYDPGGRMRTVDYDGQATVTYTYDARNLLTRVEDDLSGAWMSFSYDADGRRVGMDRSNGIETTFAYDDAGRVTGITDGTVAQQTYTLNAEGDPVGVSRSLPLDPLPPSRLATYSYDAVGQIANAGYDYDQRGRRTASPGTSYTWDGASQLTSVSTDGKTATFAHDGLRNLHARALDGVTTRYYRHYALGLAPVLAEKEGTSYKRFYVHDLDGSLLYSLTPSGAVRFYHYDRVGSTLFLTDGSGTVSDAYAYDPYGHLLDHTGDSDQPFTYVGRYGVRWEPVGNLYDMRVRYYDPETHHFLSRDPLWGVPGLIDNLNPYLYAAANPLRYIDPLGLAFTQPENHHLYQAGAHSVVGPPPDPEDHYLHQAGARAVVEAGADQVSTLAELDAATAGAQYATDQSSSADDASTSTDGTFSALGGYQSLARAGANAGDVSMSAPDLEGAWDLYWNGGRAAGWGIAGVNATRLALGNPYAVIPAGVLGYIDAYRYISTEINEGTGVSSVMPSTAGLLVQEAARAIEESDSEPTNIPIGTGGCTYTPTGGTNSPLR